MRKYGRYNRQLSTFHTIIHRSHQPENRQNRSPATGNCMPFQGTCCFWVPKSTPRRTPLNAFWLRTPVVRMPSHRKHGCGRLPQCLACCISPVATSAGCPIAGWPNTQWTTEDSKIVEYGWLITKLYLLVLVNELFNHWLTITRYQRILLAIASYCFHVRPWCSARAEVIPLGHNMAGWWRGAGEWLVNGWWVAGQRLLNCWLMVG